MNTKRRFFLIRNPEYAKCLISDKDCDFVKGTESEILGVNPMHGDLFIIDAHFSGSMSDLCGLKLVSKLQKINNERKAIILILSWFSCDYIYRYYDIEYSLRLKNVHFKQLPVSCQKI